MQARRREEAPEQAAAWPESTPEFWDMLSRRPASEVTRSAGATHESGVFALPCLLRCCRAGGREKCGHPIGVQRVTHRHTGPESGDDQ